jgi:hypothetical protein
MTREKWVRIALLLFVVGGVAWLLKLITIATMGVENPFEGPLFIIGLVTLLIGSSGLGGMLFVRASLPIYVIACVASVIVFWFFFTFMDPVGRTLFSPDRSHWFYDETGILITAVIAVVLGFILLRARADRVRPLGP